MMRKAAVIGSGFVGLQEAMLFAKNGFDVLNIREADIVSNIVEGV